MKLFLASLGALAWLLAAPAASLRAQQTLVTYAFDALTGAPTGTTKGISASDFIRDASAATFYDGEAGNPAPDANSAGWTTAATPDPALYYTFTVTGAGGLQALTFDLANFDSESTAPPTEGINAGTPGDGPTAFAVRTSLDGFTTTLLSGTVGATFSTDTVTLNTQGAASVEFRLYGYAAGSADGLLQVDNITLTGTVAPVPEPSALALALCAAAAPCAWLAVRRRVRPA